MHEGAQVLEVLVRYESDGLYSGHTHLVDLVRRIDWAKDGRSVRPVLGKLEDASLVERVQITSREIQWRPTDRGREIDGILASITADRGGSFVPWVQAGININERLALT